MSVSSPGSSCKGTDPTMRALPSGSHLNLITFPKALSLNTVTLQVRASTCKFWADTNIQSRKGILKEVRIKTTNYYSNILIL